MELDKLQASSRTTIGKGAARKIRATGAVPAVLYGGDAEPVSLSLDLHQFEHLVHGHRGEHAVVEIEVKDAPDAGGPALLKSVQHHPVRGDILHVDFLRIRLDERITTTVPIVLAGQPKGVVEGGVLDHQLREADVECLAVNIPDEFTLDVTELGIGDSIHADRLQAPEEVTILTPPERAVAAVLAPRLVKTEEEEAEAAEAEGEEPTEPEVIGEKEAEEEEGG